MDIQLLDHRFDQLRLRSGSDPEAIEHLRTFLLRSELDDRVRLNPYLIADAQMGVGRLLSEMLYAVPIGLLDMFWDIHCPHCDMLTAQHRQLTEMVGESFCPMCEYSFAVDLSDRVEVTFALGKAIEAIEVPAFCKPPAALNPRYFLACPRGQRTSGVELLEEGRYRYFCPLTSSKGVMEVKGEPSADLQHVELTQLAGYGWSLSQVSVRPGRVQIEVANPDVEFTGLVLHSDTLPQDLTPEQLPARLSGLELLHVPAYRRLFGDQVLSARERVLVRAVTLLFTDLTGSTRLYEEFGDSVAYNRVREHFQVLLLCVEKCGGALIKTIGDAVMASFRSPAEALLAATRILEELHRLNQGLPAAQQLHLKLGMHHGPALLVNLNRNLDYFGRTVNKAARIQSTAGNGELCVSEEVWKDPGFAAAPSLAAWSAPQELSVDLKGFTGRQPVFKLRHRDAVGNETPWESGRPSQDLIPS